MKMKMRKKVLKTVSAVVAAIIAASAVVPSAVTYPVTAAGGNVQIYEFENGKTSGGKIFSNGTEGLKRGGDWSDATDLSNFSGKGFSYLDQKGTTVSVEVNAPEKGLYQLTFCYCQPSDRNRKVQYLNVNGVNQGELTFPYNESFGEVSGGIVLLNKGKNTIELEGYWGYTYFDYLKVEPAPEHIANLSPTTELSNPNASDSTKRLYSYLRDQYGKHIIAGQQEYCGSHNYNSWNSPDVFIKDNEAEFEYILDKTGKQPAIRGIDLLAYSTSSTWRDDAPERAIEWTNKYHGIVTMTWHWNVPCEKGSSDIAFYVKSASDKYTTFSITKALEEGTWENEVLMADIKLIAGELKKLKDADVPVLWRPLHEAEGAWFWWGAEGAEPCKKLYRLLYDQLTNVYGLDNLIWIWTGSTSPAASEWYPGDDVVDIVGCDKYNAKDGLPNLSAISATFYSLVQSTDGQKMVTMSENDSIPSIENLVNEKAHWLYFCPWYMNYLTSEQNNPVDNLIDVYTSEYCITLDELPDLKTYPIAESTTAKAKALYGDANCDGEVDISDAVLVKQYLAAPKKYTISAQGLKNADVNNSGDGLTELDAIDIQKYTAGIIKSFNV